VGGCGQAFLLQQIAAENGLSLKQVIAVVCLCLCLSPVACLRMCLSAVSQASILAVVTRVPCCMSHAMCARVRGFIGTVCVCTHVCVGGWCVGQGDGANDIPMLKLAGLGVAFHAKPKVKKQAKVSVNTLGLDGILYLLGIRDSESLVSPHNPTTLPETPVPGYSRL